MAYLRPIRRISETVVESFGSQLVYNRIESSNNFEYGSYTYNLKNLTDESIFLFDLPENMIVQIGEICLPAIIFDYFNPLIITKTIAKRLLFTDPFPLDTFECSRIWVPTLISEEITRLLTSRSIIFRYSPDLGILYPEMKVVRISPDHPQLMKFFLEARAENILEDVLDAILTRFMMELFRNVPDDSVE